MAAPRIRVWTCCSDHSPTAPRAKQKSHEPKRALWKSVRPLGAEFQGAQPGQGHAQHILRVNGNACSVLERLLFAYHDEPRRRIQIGSRYRVTEETPASVAPTKPPDQCKVDSI